MLAAVLHCQDNVWANLAIAAYLRRAVVDAAAARLATVALDLTPCAFETRAVDLARSSGIAAAAALIRHGGDVGSGGGIT